MKFDQSNNCNGGLWVGLSNGARFNTSQWGTWCTPADIKVFAGDFNGDGRTDVMKIDRSDTRDRKSTRLNSSHLGISYAVFCLKKKKYTNTINANLEINNNDPTKERQDTSNRAPSPLTTCKQTEQRTRLRQ